MADVETGNATGVLEVDTATPTSSSLPVNSTPKKIEITISTTNDLSFPIFTLGIQAVSNLIPLVQFILLLCVIRENHQKPPDSTPNFAYRVGQIFVFMYLSFSTVTSISPLQRIKMRLFYQDKEKNHKNLIIRDGTESNKWSDAFMSLLTFELLVIWKSILSSGLLFQFYLNEVVSPADSKLINLPVSPTQYFLRMCSILAELYIMIMTIVAAVLLTNTQASLVDMLFNFAGVMVISQLDEIMSTMLPKYKISLIVNQDFDENDEPDFTRVNAEQGYVCLTVAVLLMSYIIPAML